MIPIATRVKKIISDVKNAGRHYDPAAYVAFLEAIREALAVEAAKADEPSDAEFEGFKEELDREPRR